MPDLVRAGGIPGLDFRQAALFGLALSWIAYVAGAQLAWALTQRAGLGALQPRWLVQAGRLIYYVGFPYLLLLRGAGLLAAALGLLGPAPLSRSVLGWSSGWLEGGLWAAGFTLGTWLLLAWSGRMARRTAGTAMLATLPRGWALVREVVFQQAHWAFYRAVFTVWVGTYAALFVSLLVVVAEAAADPRTWRDLRDPAGASALVVTGAMACASSAVFLFPGNLWLAAAMHLAALALLAPSMTPAREPGRP
jgi:hypothetical protein